MTFDRFRALWEKYIPERAILAPKFVDRSSEGLVDALCRAADGDHSVFVEVERILSER